MSGTETPDPPPMGQDRTMRYLTGTLDYTWDEAVNAVNGAMATETSTYQLSRHQVRWDYPGVYFVTETPDPHAAGCCHGPEGREITLAPGYEPGPGEYESWYPHLASGTASTEAEALRVYSRAFPDETAGPERHPDVHDHEEHRDGTVPGCPACTPDPACGHVLSQAQIAQHGKDRYPTPGAQYAKLLDEAGELGEALIEGQDSARVRAEYADTGLALYALGDKLGLDLIQCMADLVAADTRRFS